ncbi:MAG: hypothetical protein ACI8RD_012408, partial [Bacillariaceae sp.]
FLSEGRTNLQDEKNNVFLHSPNKSERIKVFN